MGKFDGKVLARRGASTEHVDSVDGDAIGLGKRGNPPPTLNFEVDLRSRPGSMGVHGVLISQSTFVAASMSSLGASAVTTLAPASVPTGERMPGLLR